LNIDNFLEIKEFPNEPLYLAMEYLRISYCNELEVLKIQALSNIRGAMQGRNKGGLGHDSTYSKIRLSLGLFYASITIPIHFVKLSISHPPFF
jgi:hypothetical protein